MSIKSETIKGKIIINEIISSNIKRTEYDTENKTMTTTFNNGQVYIYEGIPHTIYTRFRLAESQGKYFMAEIARKYKYTKKTK